MIEIKAKLVADRISLARSGSRARRLPTIVLGTGAVIKLAPGRSVRVTPEVFKANANLLAQFEGMLEFKGDALPDYLQEARERGREKARALKAVEPEPAPVEPEPTPVEPEPTPVEPEPTPVEPEPAPVEPEPAPVEPEIVVEKPKKKRKRRTKAEIEADKETKNG